MLYLWRLSFSMFIADDSSAGFTLLCKQFTSVVCLHKAAPLQNRLEFWVKRYRVGLIQRTEAKGVKKNLPCIVFLFTVSLCETLEGHEKKLDGDWSD